MMLPDEGSDNVPAKDKFLRVQKHL